MSDAARIGVIVLAAGASRRFGEDNKLLAEIDGVAMLTRSLNAYATLPAQKIIVLAPDSPLGDIGKAAGFTPVINPRADEGMGTSLAVGMSAAIAANKGLRHAFIGFGDMPFLSPQTPQLMVKAIDASSSIIVPTHNGRRGHPVLFAAPHFTALEKSEGDTGGRGIIAACPNVLDFAVNDAGIRLDIDTQHALAEATAP